MIFKRIINKYLDKQYTKKALRTFRDREYEINFNRHYMDVRGSNKISFDCLSESIYVHIGFTEVIERDINFEIELGTLLFLLKFVSKDKSLDKEIHNLCLDTHKILSEKLEIFKKDHPQCLKNSSYLSYQRNFKREVDIFYIKTLYSKDLNPIEKLRILYNKIAYYYNCVVIYNHAKKLENNYELIKKYGLDHKLGKQFNLGEYNSCATPGEGDRSSAFKENIKHIELYIKANHLSYDISRLLDSLEKYIKTHFLN